MEVARTTLHVLSRAAGFGLSAQYGIAGMIRGEDFLKIAERSVTGVLEADWRTAVSRGYYAAFHEARDFLIALGFQTPRADAAHAFLWRRLQNGGHVGLALAGSRLNQLRGERNQADYDIHRDLARDDAAAAVKSAAMIIDTLHGLTADERRLITDAIKTYERDVLRESTWRNRPR